MKNPIVYISWEITVLSRAFFLGYHCLWDIIDIWDTCLWIFINHLCTQVYIPRKLL